MKFNNKKTNKNEEGLSLIETMVALGVMVVGLLGGLVLATYALSYVRESRNRMIASNLAQEGIEVVRSVRDSNWLAAEEDWLYGIGESNRLGVKFNLANGFFLEPIASALEDFDPNNLDTLKNFPVNRPLAPPGSENTFRNVPVGSPGFSGFYRVITTEIIGDDELMVVCYVGWERRGKMRLVQVEEHLYDWKYLPEGVNLP